MKGEQVATQNTFKLYILHLTFLIESLHLAENKGLVHYWNFIEFCGHEIHKKISENKYLKSIFKIIVVMETLQIWPLIGSRHWAIKMDIRCVNVNVSIKFQ